MEEGRLKISDYKFLSSDFPIPPSAFRFLSSIFLRGGEWGEGLF